MPLFQNPNSTNSANYDTLTQATIGCPWLKSLEGTAKFLLGPLIMAKKDKEPVNVDVDEDEYVVQKELETLMDNARYP